MRRLLLLGLIAGLWSSSSANAAVVGHLSRDQHDVTIALAASPSAGGELVWRIGTRLRAVPIDGRGRPRGRVRALAKRVVPRSRPAAGADAQGRVVIAWWATDPTGSDEIGCCRIVQGTTIDQRGRPRRINRLSVAGTTTSYGSLLDGPQAAIGGGRAVVAWVDDLNNVWASAAASGRAIGAPLTLGETGSSEPPRVRVTPTRLGLITWTSYLSGAFDWAPGRLPVPVDRPPIRAHRAFVEGRGEAGYDYVLVLKRADGTRRTLLRLPSGVRSPAAAIVGPRVLVAWRSGADVVVRAVRR
jgi:hypothetical protein